MIKYTEKVDQLISLWLSGREVVQSKYPDNGTI